MKTQPSPAGIVHPVRARLARAIVARDAVKGRLDDARQAEQRGRDLLADAETRLAAFGDIDAEIVEFRATKFKAAATSGAAPAAMTLPASLLARERGRDEARAAVAAAKLAHESLAADLERTEKAHARADQEARAVAAEILVEEGIKVAASLRAAWSTVWRQMDELSALSTTWLPHAAGLRPARLPPDVVGLMQLIASFDHRQFPGGRNAGLAAFGAAWRRWHAALCADAEAQFDADALDERRAEVA
jgi:hypothetical protein